MAPLNKKALITLILTLLFIGLSACCKKEEDKKIDSLIQKNADDEEPKSDSLSLEEKLQANTEENDALRLKKESLLKKLEENSEILEKLEQKLN